MSETVRKWTFGLITLAICCGIILTFVSWFRVCTGSCEEGHNWRFFGMPFEVPGLLFFISLLFLHFYSLKIPHLAFYGGLMTVGALGSEAYFIYIQKAVIGTWCPVCLSIAACIFAAFVGYGSAFVSDLAIAIKQKNKGEIMNNIWKGISILSIFVLGFFMSIIGTSRFNPLEAAENTIKESLIFGQKDSPIEVYIFTDWACPACRQLEPEIEKMVPLLMKKSRLTFVDHAIHTETLNYSPYNVSFMIKNKDKYLELREALTKLSIEQPAPTDEQVEKIAEKLHTKYQQLHFSDITLSQKYFKQLGKQFGVSKTPTLVVINRETKKGKRLVGGDITEANVLKAIDSLSGTSKDHKEEPKSEEDEDKIFL